MEPTNPEQEGEVGDLAYTGGGGSLTQHGHWCSRDAQRVSGA